MNLTNQTKAQALGCKKSKNNKTISRLCGGEHQYLGRAEGLHSLSCAYRRKAAIDSNPKRPLFEIKGNVSSKGKRIYHVPGGRWYNKTRIDENNGERWFCSEADARAAGWRRSSQ